MRLTAQLDLLEPRENLLVQRGIRTALGKRDPHLQDVGALFDLAQQQSPGIGADSYTIELFRSLPGAQAREIIVVLRYTLSP
jgi:hypothetical protein